MGHADYIYNWNQRITYALFKELTSNYVAYESSY